MHTICENDTNDADTKQSEQIIGVLIASRKNVGLANLLTCQYISSSYAFRKRRMEVSSVMELSESDNGFAEYLVDLINHECAELKTNGSCRALLRCSSHAEEVEHHDRTGSDAGYHAQ